MIRVIYTKVQIRNTKNTFTAIIKIVYEKLKRKRSKYQIYLQAAAILIYVILKQITSSKLNYKNTSKQINTELSLTRKYYLFTFMMNFSYKKNGYKYIVIRQWQ